MVCKTKGGSSKKQRWGGDLKLIKNNIDCGGDVFLYVEKKKIKSQGSLGNKNSKQGGNKKNTSDCWRKCFFSILKYE